MDCEKLILPLSCRLAANGQSPAKDAARVAGQLTLPFPVLADPPRAIYRRYGLNKVLLAIQRSGTFLIDKQGRVRYIEQGAVPQFLNRDVLMREIMQLRDEVV